MDSALQFHLLLPVIAKSFAPCHSDPERSEGEESHMAQGRLREAISMAKRAKPGSKTAFTARFWFNA
jgi:hypothetical protein